LKEIWRCRTTNMKKRRRDMRNKLENGSHDNHPLPLPSQCDREVLLQTKFKPSAQRIVTIALFGVSVNRKIWSLSHLFYQPPKTSFSTRGRRTKVKKSTIEHTTVPDSS
jgi:hypothetical protein